MTIRRDEMDRLERVASIVDKVSDDPFGLAAALRRTPSYRRTIADFALPRDAFAARRRD